MENKIISIFDPKEKLSDKVLQPSSDIIYIYPPYDKKEEVKNKKAMWNPSKKCWYILNTENELYELYKRKNLLNNYELKDIYKTKGGKWDDISKNWFTYNSNQQLKEYFL